MERNHPATAGWKAATTVCGQPWHCTASNVVTVFWNSGWMVMARARAVVGAVVVPGQATSGAPAGISVAVRAAVDADMVGISGCFCAVAETGTLLLCSGAGTPATVSLLPETHIALVPVARLVATMEDAFAMVRAELGDMPRALNFISGPSRTGDIEQTIVLGAHGPCRVHLILIGETS